MMSFLKSTLRNCTTLGSVTIFIFSSSIFAANATAAGLVTVDGREVRAAVGAVILPAPPVMLSEISKFSAEWCAGNRYKVGNEIAQICYGRALFKSVRQVRAFMLVRNDGVCEVFVENGFPDVDLLELSFDIIGPVRSHLDAEYGTAELSINFLGEVDALQIHTPRHGTIGAFRGVP